MDQIEQRDCDLAAGVDGLPILRGSCPKTGWFGPTSIPPGNGLKGLVKGISVVLLTFQWLPQKDRIHLEEAEPAAC